MAPIGTKRCRMLPDGSQMVPNGTNTMVQNGTEWYRMVPNGTQWYQTMPKGTEWYQMVAIGTE